MKKHWTQRPENRKKVIALAKARWAKKPKETPTPKKTTSPRMEMLTQLAVRGALAELDELKSRQTTLTVFLNGMGVRV